MIIIIMKCNNESNEIMWKWNDNNNNDNNVMM